MQRAEVNTKMFPSTQYAHQESYIIQYGAKVLSHPTFSCIFASKMESRASLMLRSGLCGGEGGAIYPNVWPINVLTMVTMGNEESGLNSGEGACEMSMNYPAS